jgi:hypothetical protein
MVKRLRASGPRITSTVEAANLDGAKDTARDSGALSGQQQRYGPGPCRLASVTRARLRIGNPGFCLRT